MLSAVIDNKMNSGPTRLKKKSQTIYKHDSLFVVKYVSLGRSHQPMIKVIKHLWNLYKLKWLHPCVVFSHHTNLQEKLLRDLRWKVLWGVVDADFGWHPCNCPRKYKVNASTSCAAMPEVYTKFCVMLIIVIASTLVNLNKTSRGASKNI
jgi:hypothetical protein